MGKNNPSGFTLIELIVVLVIVGFLSALVMPRVFGTLTNVKLKTATRDTVSFLHHARDLAYYQKKYVKVAFDLDKRQIAILAYQRKVVEEEDVSFTGPEMEWVQMKALSLTDNVKFEKCVQKDKTIAEGLFNIIFYPAGNTDGGRITLMNKKGRMFLIEVDTITGNAQIIEENE